LVTFWALIVGERTLTGSGHEAAPGGDLLGQILRELEEGIREARVKPVIVGPFEIDIPGKSAPAGPNQP
jgi:hypothetical protein